MAIENITAIISDDAKRDKLIALIERQHALNLAMVVHKQEKEQITADAKALGFKASEFNQFTKLLKDDGDLLNYNRALLETISALREFIEG